MRRLPILLFVIGATLLSGPAWCNPSPPQKLDNFPFSILIDYVFDVFFLALCMVMLRKPVRAREVMKIGLVVALAGSVADFVGMGLGGILPRLLFSPGPAIHYYHGQLAGLAGGTIFPVLLICAANYAIGRHHFKMARRESVWLGLVMGVATAPFVSPELTYMYLGGKFDDDVLMAGTLGIFLVADIAILLSVRGGREAGRTASSGAIALAAVVLLASGAYRVTQVRTAAASWHRVPCHGQLYKVRDALGEYHIDHGEYPDSLKVLVPKYLAASGLHCPYNRSAAYRYHKPSERGWNPSDMPEAIVYCARHRSFLSNRWSVESKHE